MAIDGHYTTEYHDMPKTATFEELIVAAGFNDYVERHGLWHIILNNGVYYTEDRSDNEKGNRCGVLQALDKNCL